MLENEKCYKKGHISTCNFTVCMWTSKDRKVVSRKSMLGHVNKECDKLISSKFLILVFLWSFLKITYFLDKADTHVKGKRSLLSPVIEQATEVFLSRCSGPKWSYHRIAMQIVCSKKHTYLTFFYRFKTVRIIHRFLALSIWT